MCYNELVLELSSNALQPLAAIVQSVFQGATLSRYRDEGGELYQVLNASDLGAIVLNQPREVMTTEALKPGPYKDYALRADDILIATRGNDLKASVVPEAFEGALAGANLTVVRPVKNARGDFMSLHPVYLAGLFRTDWLKHRLASFYLQSSQVQILTVKQLRELELPLPPLGTQAILADLFLAFESYAELTAELVEGKRQLLEAALQKTLGESHADTN